MANAEPDTEPDAAADAKSDAAAYIQPNEDPDGRSVPQSNGAANAHSNAAAHAIPDSKPNAVVSTWHTATRRAVPGLHGRSFQRIGKCRDM